MLNKLYLYLATLLIALCIVLYLGINHYIHNKIDSSIQQGMNEFILTSQNKAIEKIALDTQNYLLQSSKLQESLIKKYNAIPSSTLPLLEVTPNSNQTNQLSRVNKLNQSSQTSQLSNSSQTNTSNNQTNPNSKSLNKKRNEKEKEIEDENEELSLDDFEFPSFKSVFPNLQTKEKNCETQIKEIRNALDLFFNTSHAF